jgi:hypothetical protein
LGGTGGLADNLAALFGVLGYIMAFGSIIPYFFFNPEFNHFKSIYDSPNSIE